MPLTSLGADAPDYVRYHDPAAVLTYALELTLFVRLDPSYFADGFDVFCFRPDWHATAGDVQRL
jgi:hypothetical protein